MMARSVADVLISFGAPDPVAAAEEVAAASEAADLDCEEAVETRRAAIAAAREEGLAEGLMRAAAAQAAARAAAVDAAHDAYAARLAAERSRWVQDEGRVLADMLALGLAEIETRIAAHTARALRELIADRVIARAIDQLAEHVRALLSGADGRVLQVTGPEDLVAALREKLGGGSAAIDFRPGPSADVRIVCGDTLVESRLAAWLERLAALVE
jgi:hypothetical protein